MNFSEQCISSEVIYVIVLCLALLGDRDYDVICDIAAYCFLRYSAIRVDSISDLLQQD